MSEAGYVIGVDYGTDSIRSIIVDASNGEQVSDAVHYYRRWKQGKFCHPAQNQFRQHPLDYIEGLQITVQEALSKAPPGMADKIKGISVDTTGSTPAPVDKDGVVLALKPEFKDNPNAMFILWKDHTAVKEAEEINNIAHNWGGEDYTKYVGGVYSSEWFWAKILHTIRDDGKIKKAAFSWVEHCDWIPALLTGHTNPLTIKRSRCAAGHKAMWHESFGGLPSEEFLTKVDPLLKGLRKHLYHQTHTVDVKVGTLSSEWAKELGLREDVAVGVGAFDAHLGAVGAEIKPHILTKVMGTSTCDMLIAPMKEMGDKLIKGICGQVDGSIIPGMLGMEAGQSAFGDVFSWFKDILAWPLTHILKNDEHSAIELDNDSMEKLSKKIIPELSKQAEKVPIGETGIVALDWLHGRRTPYANQQLKGAIMGLSLGSDTPKVFRALVEATAFGAKKIVDCFQSQGVDIKEVIALGGVAKKSPFVMQVVSDVLGMGIEVARSEQACALGAAMCAATVAGIYPTVQDAQDAMGNRFEDVYRPVAENTEKYNMLYEKYSRIGEFAEKEYAK